MRRYKPRDMKCYTVSYFQCKECGNYITVPRMIHSHREKNHKKNLWCPFCKEEKTLEENRYCDHVRNMLGEVIG